MQLVTERAFNKTMEKWFEKFQKLFANVILVYRSRVGRHLEVVISLPTLFLVEKLHTATDLANIEIKLQKHYELLEE